MLKKTEGVKSVEINKSQRTAKVVFDNEVLTLDELLEVLAQGWNGRYKAEVKGSKTQK